MGTTKDNELSRNVDKGERAAKKAAASPLVDTLTRLGYAARGVIYALMGVLALEIAMGGQTKRPNQQGAIEYIGSQPYGRYLLYIIIIGLIGYALWGLIRAVLDPLHKGSDMKGLIARAGYLVSAFSYAILIYPTYQFTKGSTSALSSSSNGTQNLAAQILTKPWGPPVLGIFALLLIAGGLNQIRIGWKSDFDLVFKNYALNPEQKRFATLLGRIGYIARGIVFALVGLFLGQAALHLNPNEARGIDGALQALAQQQYGVYLLGLVALGLVAFGLYSIMGALWFRIKH